MDSIIVIGGGIAGLYYAYRYMQKHPKARLVLLERSGRLGGRAGISTFQGLRVVCGAGIGRKAKDKNLIQLLNELGVPHHEFEVTHAFSPAIDPQDVTTTMAVLKGVAVAEPCDKRPTFKKLAAKALGSKKYNAFVRATGYTDFELADVFDIIKYYGMEDNAENWVGVSVPWDLLIKKLEESVSALGGTVLINHIVDKVTELPEGGVKVHCSNGSCYTSSNLVIATTVDAAKVLLPQHIKLLSNTCGQPFLRVYAKVSTACKATMRKAVSSLTIVPPPLQKIIPIDPSKGVYMIAYADNKAALHLQSILSKTSDSESRAHFARLLETSLGLENKSITISKLQGHFYNVGTHYNKPLPCGFTTRRQFLKAVQRPSKHITLVGEMVALHQGWVEGALESVHAVI